MKTTFNAREGVSKMIDGYAAEEKIAKKDAINDLIEAGWIAKHQDLLAGTLIGDVRLAVEALLQADRRDREDSLDELLIELDDRLEVVRLLAEAANKLIEAR